ncbi:MAG TPA: hypothetical protein VHD91_11455 [Gaiellaceae bacterium]|nr:hypothetical protein [Gaiellaceae bacterium]
MDAAQALADLTEISSQIEAAVLFSADGSVAGSTLADDARAQSLAGAALEILEAAGGESVAQVEASTREGAVFVVRDGERGIVAVTSVDPTVGLVFYDLKSCLRNAGDEKPKRRRRPAAKEDGDA